MKTIVISFSLSGNNDVLAQSIAESLSADHIRINEHKQRTFLSTGLDMLFNRIPKVKCTDEKIEDYDTVIFVGPIWMGSIAAPFRAYFKKYRKNLTRYAFISISGGADGPNSKLTLELRNRIGKDPLFVMNWLIAELIRKDTKPSRKEIEDYRVTPHEANRLTSNLSEVFQKLNY